MVGVRCVVCSKGGTSSDVNLKGVTYHRFPTNARQRQRWVESIMGHTIRDVTPERLKWMLQDDTIFGNWRVCSRHFEQSCFSESAIRKRLSSTARTLLNFDAVPTLFSEDEISEQGPKYPELQKLLKPKEPEEHSGAPGVQLSSVKETGKRKRTEDTPDVVVQSLTPVYLHSQLSRWKGACNKLELTDNQMAKFLLDRYYKGDKSVSTFSSSTHKTLLLDRELLTLWNDSMAAKGFSSDVDFLWFLLLGPQKSGTDSKGCTVRDHGASEECVPVKVDYVGPGYTASDTIQDSNANHPLILQPPTCIPSPTQKNNITETAMTTQVPVTSQNNEMQMPRHKKSRKQVLEELSQDDPVFPESFGKEGSRCDIVDTTPTQQEVGRTENHASTSYMATQRSSNTTSRAKSRKQVNPQPGPREKPAKDLGNFENITTCSKPTSGEVGIDFKEEEELKTDPSDCDHSSTTCITSQLSFGTGGIHVKQDDHRHSISSQLSRDSAVRIKVEKEDELNVNLSNFDNTNASCPQLGANIKEESKNTIDYENTNTPQLSHNTVSIKVEKEDGLEVDFGCYGNTNTSSHQSLEEELEMQLDSAIMASSKHLG